MSGYTEALLRQQGLLQEGNEFLQKPFGPLQLARRIRRLLDA